MFLGPGFDSLRIHLVKNFVGPTDGVVEAMTTSPLDLEQGNRSLLQVCCYCGTVRVPPTDKDGTALAIPSPLPFVTLVGEDALVRTLPAVDVDRALSSALLAIVVDRF